MRRGLPIFLLAVVILLATPAHSGLIWDYSPSVGALTSGFFVNRSDQTNFADLVYFPSGAVVTEYHHFTGVHALATNTFRFRLRADNSGVPGALLSEFDDTYDSHTLVGSFYANLDNQDENIYRTVFTFPGISLAPGTYYWIGAAGLNVNVGQAGVQAPGDSRMAQFYGPNYQQMTSTEIGDQSFQLYGTLGPGPEIPEPGTFVLTGLGAIGLAFARRLWRKRQARRMNEAH